MKRLRFLAAVPVGLLALASLAGCQTHAKHNTCAAVGPASCSDATGCGNTAGACSKITSCAASGCGINGGGNGCGNNGCAATGCGNNGCLTGKSGCGNGASCATSGCATSAGGNGCATGSKACGAALSNSISPCPATATPHEHSAPTHGALKANHYDTAPIPPVMDQAPQQRTSPAPPLPEAVNYEAGARKPANSTVRDARRIPADRLQVLHRESGGVPVVVPNGQAAVNVPAAIQTRLEPVNDLRDETRHELPIVRNGTDRYSRPWSDALGLPEGESEVFGAWVKKQPTRIADQPRTDGVRRN